MRHVLPAAQRRHIPAALPVAAGNHGQMQIGRLKRQFFVIQGPYFYLTSILLLHLKIFKKVAYELINFLTINQLTIILNFIFFEGNNSYQSFFSEGLFFFKDSHFIARN